MNETVVGVICHIEAAEEGGERYNPNQTDEERRSFENLILLCGTHHTITNDVIQYPVTVMRDMKTRHEAQFRDQQFDASDEIIEQAISNFFVYQTNISQGGVQYITLNQGLDATAITVLFSALLEANFPRLIAAAQDEARRAVTQFRQDFIRVADKTLVPEDIEKLSDPDIQYVMNEAIQTIARRNRPELRGNLSYLLVERIKHNGNDRLSIVLNEAIRTVGRLTHDQLKLLALWFTGSVLIQWHAIETWDQLDRYMQKYMRPFLDIEESFRDISHLIHAGCCYFRPIRPYYFVEQSKNLLLPLFAVRDSIPVDDLRIANSSLELLENAFEHLDEYRVRFRFKTQDAWEKFISATRMASTDTLLLRSLWEKTYASEGGEDDNEIDTPAGKLMIKNVSVGKEAIHTWNESGLPNIECVSMGVVLGAAYCAHALGESFDLASLI